jgi:hypothetical protein
MMEARRIVVLGVPLLASLLVAGGCAVAPRTAIPPDLPNTTREQFLTLRWALVRERGKAQAVGRAESTSGSRWDATVALEGLDGHGRVVSHGSAIVRPGFGPGPTPFEAELVPAGAETEFRLRVVSAQQFSRPSR